MTLYTKKRGKFIELDSKQVRRMRRTDQVVALQKSSASAASALILLAAWMEGLTRRDGKLEIMAGKAIVVSAPAAVLLRERATAVATALKELRQS